MAPFWTDHFYNPSAPYPEAVDVHAAVDTARAAVAALLGADVQSIVWTSGGTESNNWVLHGIWRSRPSHRRRVVLSAIEHPAVTETAAVLESLGAEIVTIPVDSRGVLRLDALDAVLDEQTALISVMLANNEIGTLQPVAEVARRAHAVGAWVHTDAAQAVGKIPVDVKTLDVDFLSVAGHKFYAPKGIGVLYIRPGVALPPLLTGGGQQEGRRSGTEPVPLIVGLGKAAQLAHTGLQDGGPGRQAVLRDALESQLRAVNPAFVIFGTGAERLPNTVAIAHPDWTGSTLLAACPQIRAGTGSACHHPDDTGSPTIRAMGMAPALARGLVRLSFGRETTAEDLEVAVTALTQAIQQRST
jgi:cysteine desulfurase